MRGLLRVVLAVLVLAFTAGTVLHVTRAAAMNLAMVAASSADMQMPGCDGCGDNGGGTPESAMGSCVALCTTPPMAPPATRPLMAALAPAVVEPAAGLPSPAGLTGPPDRPPPRTSVLS